MNTKVKKEETYPSVDLAYEIALKSYDWAIQRLDAIEARVDQLLAWFSAVNLGVISIIATQAPSSQITFRSTWFYVAMVLFLITISLGFYSKFRRELTLIDPKKLYEETMHKTPWEFKKDSIYWAGKHSGSNRDFIAWKANLSRWMIAAFALESIFLVCWLIFS
jgi:hypothetical protein